MTIVCATHFTDSSTSAARAAACLASARNSPWRREDFIDDTLALERAALMGLELTTEREILHGSLDATMDAFCARKEASLLVVSDGSTARASVFSAPLERVLPTVDVPTLVVRDARPFDLWSRGAAPLKVLLAVDATWNAELACNWLTNLAASGPISLEVSFVWWPEEAQDRMALESSLLEKLTRALEALPPNIMTRAHVDFGHDGIAATLLRLANEAKVDVLVFGGAPAMGRLAAARSNAHGVLVEAPMSVACIPAHGSPFFEATTSNS